MDGEADVGRSFLVWGAGGHGKVVADLIRSLGFEVTGYLDGDPRKLGEVVEPGGARVLITDEEWEANGGETGFGDRRLCYALAIGSNSLRERALLRLDRWDLPALVHPSAVLSPSAVIGRGSVVLPRAIVNAAARIGQAVIVNSGSIVEHDCVVADAAHVSPGAVLSGGVHVGERTWIGAGATIIQGVTVGADAVVGAGAVVIRDVPDGSTVVGNPARALHGGKFLPDDD
jgi:sugar O-acyltransferase (sialic acid O-acetyltransferase NeuD family)